jgi:hypothetical protein
MFCHQKEEESLFVCKSSFIHRQEEEVIPETKAKQPKYLPGEKLLIKLGKERKKQKKRLMLIRYQGVYLVYYMSLYAKWGCLRAIS